jgi:transcriptional regulator with XRE-family HTH domain/cytochrome c-type biogenesis protein CcmH/NrfG
MDGGGAVSDGDHGDPSASAFSPIRSRIELAAWVRRYLLRYERSQGRPVNRSALAKAVHVSPSSLYAYLNGTTLPPAVKFDALLAELDVPVLQRRWLATARDELDVTGTSGKRQVPSVRPSSPPIGPRQLPTDVAGFTGRTDHLRCLDVLLADSHPATAVVISVIGGSAGIGKTALAIHWAHQVANRFPDGQLYINLRGFDPSGDPVEPATAIRGFLSALEVPPQRIPADLQAQTALYRSLLSDRRVLIVLDNARDAGQVRPLLPGSPRCLVLVTSRNRLTGLVAIDGAHSLALDPLPAREARDLLARRLGTERTDAEPDAVGDIVRMCGGLPLALVVAAAHTITHPQPLDTLATQLRDIRRRLDVLTGDDPASDLRAVFSWSYQTLDPDTSRLFRYLALHPGPDITPPAVASLTGADPARVSILLKRLTGANLLIEQVPGRYTFHDLIRVYATELVHATDTDEQRYAATRRMLDHYLRTGFAANRLLNPARDPITLTPPAPTVTARTFTDASDALAWFTTEYPVLSALVHHAAAHGFDTHAWQLAWTLTTFLDRRGHWHDWVAVQRTAVAAAQRLGDPGALGRAEDNLAAAYMRVGRYHDAHAHLRHSLDLAIGERDELAQAHAHNKLALLWECQGDHRVSLDHAQQALSLYRAVDYGIGQAIALNVVGWCQARLGDYEQALATCKQAQPLQHEIGDRHGQASTWDSLGYAYHHLGNYKEAVACYGHARDLFRDVGDRYGEADTLTRLGDSHKGGGDPRAAREAWQSALAILTDLDHPDATPVHARLAAPDEQT